MSVKREDLTPEWVAAAVRRIRKDGFFEPLGDGERAASLARILAGVSPGEDAWMFGYGSLMWNPMVHFGEQRPGLLHGYNRKYCFWVRSGRASPELPSLGLGLDRGGSCRGMVFRIPAQEVPHEFELLWRREMISGVYLPRWVTVHTPRGRVRAVTFVVDRGHKRYVRRVSPEKAARHIARAEGPRGSAREYLRNTVARLSEMGFSDRNLSRLHELVLLEGRD